MECAHCGDEIDPRGPELCSPCSEDEEKAQYLSDIEHRWRDRQWYVRHSREHRCYEVLECRGDSTSVVVAVVLDEDVAKAIAAAPADVDFLRKPK